MDDIKSRLDVLLSAGHGIKKLIDDLENSLSSAKKEKDQWDAHIVRAKEEYSILAKKIAQESREHDEKIKASLTNIESIKRQTESLKAEADSKVVAAISLLSSAENKEKAANDTLAYAQKIKVENEQKAERIKEAARNVG